MRVELPQGVIVRDDRVVNKRPWPLNRWRRMGADGAAMLRALATVDPGPCLEVNPIVAARVPFARKAMPTWDGLRPEWRAARTAETFNYLDAMTSHKIKHKVSRGVIW